MFLTRAFHFFGRITRETACGRSSLNVFINTYSSSKETKWGGRQCTLAHVESVGADGMLTQETETVRLSESTVWILTTWSNLRTSTNLKKTHKNQDFTYGHNCVA